MQSTAKTPARTLTARAAVQAAAFILLAGCAPLLAGQPPQDPLRSGATAGRTRRPNVLLIAVDDLNDWVGALGGHPQAYTPNLDRLAAQGMLFTNAHCQAPVCAASRASLFTGQLPSTTGLYFLTPDLTTARADERAGVAPEGTPSLLAHPTLVECFAAEGYATWGVGKVYHGDESPYFQEYGGGMGGFGPRPAEKLSYPEGHPLWDWGVYPKGQTPGDWGAHPKGQTAQDAGTGEADLPSPSQPPDPDAQMPDTQVAAWAAERLAAEHEDPFFLAVGFWRPHVPMYAPQRWFDLHPLDEVQLPEVLETDRDDLSEYAKALTIGHPAPRHEWLVEHDQWRPAVQAYLACTSFVDSCVGTVLDALAKGPHAKNTIVVLLSDHGFHLGEKARWAKRSLWDESTRVPLIVAAPGRDPGTTDAPVGLVDLYPTLLELCGLEGEPALDGHSLTPLLEDPIGHPWPHLTLTTFGPGNHAIHGDEWTSIHYADGTEEWYDRAKDPHQWWNRICEEANPTTVNKHREAAAHPQSRHRGGSSAGMEAWRQAESSSR